MTIHIPVGRESEPMMDINTTPLIDVMLVLLVMLIITIPVMTHAIKLDMPQVSAPQPPVIPTVIEVAIDDDGTVYWNGEVVQMAALEARFQAESQRKPQADVRVRPDRWVKYDYVAQVLAAAQRGHMNKMGLVGNEQYM